MKSTTFDHIGAPTAGVAVEAGPPAGPPAPSPNWLAWVRTPTGPGPVAAYTEHPANWNGSLAVARLLRGITGFLGASDFAILDILIGLLELWQGRRGPRAASAAAPDEDWDSTP